MVCRLTLLIESSGFLASSRLILAEDTESRKLKTQLNEFSSQTDEGRNNRPSQIKVSIENLL